MAETEIVEEQRQTMQCHPLTDKLPQTLKMNATSTPNAHTFTAVATAAAVFGGSGRNLMRTCTIMHTRVILHILVKLAFPIQITMLNIW